MELSFRLTLGGLAGLLPPLSMALTVTAPSDLIVPAGQDFATEVIGDPWDFDGPQDIEIAELRHLTEPEFVDGLLHATTTGVDSNIWLIYQGVPSAFNLTRGARYPIDTRRFTSLSVKMRLRMEDGSELAGSNRNMNVYFYENENAIPHGRYGWTRLRQFPDNQWHILELDLTDPSNTNPNWPGWSDFSRVEGFRLDPSGGLAGVAVELDWVRLSGTPDESSSVVVSWNNARGPVNIFAMHSDGARLLLATDQAGGSAMVSMHALAPGDYRIVVDDGTTEGLSPGVVTVNTPPRIAFSNPSIRGDLERSYGRVVNQNDWQWIDPGDIERTINVANVSYTNPPGTLYGRPITWDPSIVFETPRGIDSDYYRQLCYTLEIAGDRNIRDGSVARVFWGDELHLLLTSEDIVVQSGVNEYCLGDMRNVPLEDGPTGQWQGSIRWFRIDPHEFTPPAPAGCPESGTPEHCRDFRLHSVSLAPLERPDPHFEIVWTSHDTKPDTRLRLYLDPDRDPENGNAILIASDILPAEVNSLNFDFSTLGAAPGEYWILGVIEDDFNKTMQYAKGAIRLDEFDTSTIFFDRFQQR